MLNVDKQERGEVIIVGLKGKLDVLTSPEFNTESAALAAAGHTKVVLDLRGLEEIDSSGVAAIVGMRKHLRAKQGDMTIAGIDGQPGQIFKLLRLDRVFELCPTVEQAVAHLNG